MVESCIGLKSEMCLWLAVDLVSYFLGSFIYLIHESPSMHFDFRMALIHLVAFGSILVLFPLILCRLDFEIWYCNPSKG